jgi:NAD(P)-dependent dehydrogenase (short-subunit alcohol dehydrogenase family)
MMRTIFITGVSTGIGFYLTKQFLSKGYQVFGTVRKQIDADRLLNDFPKRFTPLNMDVTKPDEIKNAVNIVSETLNGETLTGLINNAGIALTGALETLTTDDYREQFEVNFFGMIEVTRQFLPLLGTDRLRQGKPGKIINISSNVGQIGLPFLSPYCASKHAVEGLSQSLRRELLLYGIDVIIIGPAAIKTPIWEKESAITIPESVQNSDYAKSMSIFQKMFRKEGERGMEPQKLAKQIYDIFEKKNPKTRYALAQHKVSEWIVPRYLLSDRMLDNMMKKMFK